MNKRSIFARNYCRCLLGYHCHCGRKHMLSLFFSFHNYKINYCITIRAESSLHSEMYQDFNMKLNCFHLCHMATVLIHSYRKTKNYYPFSFTQQWFPLFREFVASQHHPLLMCFQTSSHSHFTDIWILVRLLTQHVGFLGKSLL